ncbi:MAG: ATP-binding protein [Planctomycetia bacterium]|nr:ATP-binding protein [Planctomycetia bacterium]
MATAPDSPKPERKSRLNPVPPPVPSPEGEVIRVLLIDDDRDDYFLTREMLSDIPGERYRLDWTPNYDAGLQALCEGTHDIYLLDYRLGARTGIELLREIRSRACSGPVILFTGQGQSRTDLEALDAGADDYLEKAGLTPALLERSIRFALVQHRASVELERKVRERTEELARANAALREADRRKDVFLATLAHELRNPLAPIRNALEIIRLANDTGEMVRKQRERLERQVSYLIRLIEDLLDVSRITTGKLRLNTEELTIQDVLESALDTSRSQLDAAKLALNVEMPAEPVRLIGDRVRLTQVFANLLNNSAKFTEPDGQVSIRVTANTDRVSVTVRDTGVGISPDALPHLFDLFTQVDRSAGRSTNGLGIGLALVHRLVGMHGGQVFAHSDGPGKGATFIVVLPTIGQTATSIPTPQ